MGSSKPWPEAMEVMTGQRKMDAGPLIEYFQPLIKWLEKQNLHERPGWTEACPPEQVSFPSGGQKTKDCFTSSASHVRMNFIVLLALYSTFNFVRQLFL